jgi:uncharacterized membrane protein
VRIGWNAVTKGIWRGSTAFAAYLVGTAALYGASEINIIIAVVIFLFIFLGSFMEPIQKSEKSADT